MGNLGDSFTPAADFKPLEVPPLFSDRGDCVLSCGQLTWFELCSILAACNWWQSLSVTGRTAATHFKPLAS